MGVTLDRVLEKKPEKINEVSFSEKSECFIMKGCFYFEVNTNLVLGEKKKKSLTNTMACFVFLQTLLLFFIVLVCFIMKYVNNWTQSDLFRFVCMVGVRRLGGFGWFFSHFVHQTRNPISCTVLILESCSGLGDITSPSLLLLLS